MSRQTALPAVLTPPRTPLNPPTTSRLSTVALLRSSQLARAIYNFQALLYEFGYTDAVPDGVDGPITQRLIDQVNADTGGAGGTPLQQAHFAVLARYGANAQPIRVVPDVLPADLIAMLNSDARALDPYAVLIQANA